MLNSKNNLGQNIKSYTFYVSMLNNNKGIKNLNLLLYTKFFEKF